MKMGTGKTKVACDLIRLKLKCIDVIIWIAPASLISSGKYVGEIKKWSRGFFNKILFYTTESISKSDEKYFEMREFAGIQKSFCVVDESILIKSFDESIPEFKHFNIVENEIENVV